MKMDCDQLVGGDVWWPALALLKWVVQETPAIRNLMFTGWV